MKKWIAFWLATVATIGPASADEHVDACIDAADRAQALRDQGHLLEARRGFLTCAAGSCPSPIRKDCGRWHEEVSALVPSIVPRARDASGKDLTDATVDVDGAPVPIDGRPFELDPGRHELAWKRGTEVLTETIVVRAAEKNRPVDASFDVPQPIVERVPPSDGVQPPPVRDGAVSSATTTDGVEVPVSSWILGGVGVIGGVLFAVFAADAVSQRDHLRETCAPGCPQSDVDAIERTLIVANLAGGVALATFGAGLTIAILSNLESDEGSTKSSSLPFEVTISSTQQSLLLRGWF